MIPRRSRGTIPTRVKLSKEDLTQPSRPNAARSVEGEGFALLEVCGSTYESRMKPKHSRLTRATLLPAQLQFPRRSISLSFASSGEPAKPALQAASPEVWTYRRTQRGSSRPAGLALIPAQAARKACICAGVRFATLRSNVSDCWNRMRSLLLPPASFVLSIW